MLFTIVLVCSSLAAPGTVILVCSQHLLATPSPSPLLTQCERCLEDCMGSHGWVVGIANHGSVILSRGRLVTVKTPGYPRHSPVLLHLLNTVMTQVSFNGNLSGDKFTSSVMSSDITIHPQISTPPLNKCPFCWP